MDTDAGRRVFCSCFHPCCLVEGNEHEFVPLILFGKEAKVQIQALITDLLDPCRLRLYVWFAVLLACVLGLLGFPRHWEGRRRPPQNPETPEESESKKQPESKEQPESKWVSIGEAVRSTIWDILIHTVGFLLLPLLVFLTYTICARESTGAQVVSGLLFLPIFFYMILCITGRGVQVMQTAVMDGIQEISFSFSKGIRIVFGNK